MDAGLSARARSAISVVCRRRARGAPAGRRAIWKPGPPSLGARPESFGSSSRRSQPNRREVEVTYSI